jgi:xanthine/CO dehydrogenase XdhC/CoxF family maturation factor
MHDDLETAIAESLARGEPVALATVAEGAGPGLRPGLRMLIWKAGHTRGDLGWPRLNQRVALYAEQLLERGARPVEKPFDGQGGRVVVRFEFFKSE